MKKIKDSLILGFTGISAHALRLARNTVIARIISPEDVGNFALIVSIISAFEAFTQIGLKEAIVHNNKSKEWPLINSAFWLSSIRGFLLCLIGIIVSPHISKMYNFESKTLFLQISFLTIFFQGLCSPAMFISLKKLEINKWNIIQNVSAIISICIITGLLLLFKSVLVLIIGVFFEAGLKMVLSYIICPFKIKIEINKSELNELLKYSKGMFGLPLLFFIFSKIDILFLGKMVPKESVGIYNMIFSLSQIPFMLCNIVLDPILLPIFSRTKDNLTTVSEILKISINIIILTFAPICVFIAFEGHSILELVYGETYKPYRILFLLLFTSETMRIISIPIVSLYFSFGYPNIQRRISFYRVIILLIIIYPMVKTIGEKGAAISLLITSSITNLLQIVMFPVDNVIKIRILKNLIIVILLSMSLAIFLSVASNIYLKALMLISILIIGYIILYVKEIEFIKNVKIMPNP